MGSGFEMSYVGMTAEEAAQRLLKEMNENFEAKLEAKKDASELRAILDNTEHTVDVLSGFASTCQCRPDA